MRSDRRATTEARRSSGGRLHHHDALRPRPRAITTSELFGPPVPHSCCVPTPRGFSGTGLERRNPREAQSQARRLVVPTDLQASGDQAEDGSESGAATPSF